MIPILVLDFDGVLNNAEFFTRRAARWKRLEAEGRDLVIEREREDLAPENLAELAYLMASVPEMEVVVSSTWRLGRSLGDLSRMLVAGGVAPRRMRGVTPRFPGKHRGQEIQDWLEQNRHDASRIIILDDDRDMDHLMPRLVHTDYFVGLTRANVNQALDLLGVTAEDRK
jgi:hypothetical protein